MDVSNSDIWLLWGFIGFLLLIPVFLRLITRPLERKLDRLQERNTKGCRGKVAMAAIMGALIVGSSYFGSYLAKGDFDRKYDQMRRP
jgi:hypothetical protein